jgi:hypothetical protein
MKILSCFITLYQNERVECRYKRHKEKRISRKTCTHRITGPEINKYDNSLNQGLENREAFKEYKKFQRRIQKMIGRKRNHSNVLTK